MFYQEAIVDGGNVRPVVPQIDDEAVQGIGRVQLGHGTFEDGEPGNVETFEEHLTDAFAG